MLIGSSFSKYQTIDIVTGNGEDHSNCLGQRVSAIDPHVVLVGTKPQLRLEGSDTNHEGPTEDNPFTESKLLCIFRKKFKPSKVQRDTHDQNCDHIFCSSQLCNLIDRVSRSHI